MTLLPANRRWRIAAIAGYGVIAVGAVLLIVVAAFPLDYFKPLIERRLSAHFARPVTIASIERQDSFTLTPTVVIRGLRVPQPDWVGPGSGDLARVDRAIVAFPALPALAGRFDPSAVTLDGGRFALIRDANRRENWRGAAAREGGRGGGIGLARLTIRDTRLSYRDAVQDRAFVVSVTADPRRGIAVRGIGMVRGSAVRVAATGAGGVAAGAAWPFTVRIDGADLNVQASGTMAAPLDTNDMTLDVTARASGLKMIDAVIEAGLFDTRAVNLAAHVERRASKWNVTRLAGTIGTSRIAGQVTIDKVDGRTKLDGAMRSDRLDFDDLASPASSIAAAARAQAIGKRLVPDTRINIAKIEKTDARFTFRVTNVVSAHGRSSIRAMRGALVMDRRVLTIAPLAIDLAQGTITGRAIIDQRDGAPKPRATFDLRLNGSTIAALAGGGGSVNGQARARAYLIGRGDTIREAVAAADGRIGFAARDGALPADMAAELGFDAGRAIFADHDEAVGLRCVIVGVAVRHGVGQVAPMVVDTTQSQLRGEGTISFPSEALAIRLTGAPKQGAVLRLPGSVTLAGTIREPDLIVPKDVKSIGNIFKAIGRAITGRQGAAATDADCGGLAAEVLR